MFFGLMQRKESPRKDPEPQQEETEIHCSWNEQVEV
jgi:hypothetical protein